VRNRRLLLDGLARLAGMGRPLGANEANFVLVPVLARDGSGRADSARAQAIYKSMAEHRGVVVRYRGNELGCEGCLRITVGSEAEVGVALERLAEALAEL
jgi:histidinol-phosphate aminotransferase